MIPNRQDVPIKCFAVAAYVCRLVPGGMNVLLIRRSEGYLGGSWQMVSGKIEKGELAWEAALREIEEETGLIPDRFYSADLVESFYEVSQNCMNLIPIFAAFIDSDRDVRLSSEHTEFRWVPFATLLDYVAFAHQAEHAEKIYQRFVARDPTRFLQIDITKRQRTAQPGATDNPDGAQ